MLTICLAVEITEQKIKTNITENSEKCSLFVLTVKTDIFKLLVLFDKESKTLNFSD